MTASEILHSHNLKRTSCREGIINTIISASNALSEVEIRKMLQGNYDRTTFYRSFKTLTESGIIHSIVIENQPVKYAVEKDCCEGYEHIHFFCKKCKTVTCIETTAIAKPELPIGFIESSTEIIIKGICLNCNH
jgi:Fur family ferric uptake transcriptional regulator